MSTDQDQARLIAERVARRVAGSRADVPRAGNSSAAGNGAPVREELSAIREGLHHLESKLEQIESKIVRSPGQTGEPTRARLINFVSSDPPKVVQPSISSTPAILPTPQSSPVAVSTGPAEFVPATQSPWLRDFNNSISHPSQERFGVEEATVAELVEFFESEKKCSVEPGGKPCDHCAMCSSRGF